MAQSAHTIAAAAAATAEKAVIKVLLIQMKWPKDAAEAFVEDHGIDDLDTLQYLIKDTATALCCTLRKAGGGDDGVIICHG